MSFSLDTAQAGPSSAVDLRETVVVSNAGTVATTLTTTQVLGKVVYATPAANANFTLPSAASLVAADKKAEVGTAFRLFLANRASSSVITIVAGSGVTLAGSATLAAASGSQLLIQYTNVTSGAEAYTAVRLI